jgi:hypothetical protein
MASFGGSYLAVEAERAQFYAMMHERWVVLLIEPLFPLGPDEDWVTFGDVRADPLDTRYTRFFSDLADLSSDFGLRITDSYRKCYDHLNTKHSITWRTSFEWLGTARQPCKIFQEQIIEVAQMSD